MKKLVVLSGAGISQESGLKTFRDMGGLWEEFDVMDVCHPSAWEKNQSLVNRFYNERRKQLQKCSPNSAHAALAQLEEWFQVNIITQNVDNLHERAGSSNVLHLHGELTKVRSVIDPNYVIELEGWELKDDASCPKGGKLRPHIVWFTEPVPAMDKAIDIVEQADILLVVGTSLNVYPAAGLVNYVNNDCSIYVIDPEKPAINADVVFIEDKATTGMQRFLELL